jgi:hypothetical protein
VNTEGRISKGLISAVQSRGLSQPDLVTICLVIEITMSDGGDVLEVVQALREEGDQVTAIPGYSFLKSIRRWPFLRPVVVEACAQIRDVASLGRKDAVLRATLNTASSVISFDQYAKGLLHAYNWYFAAGQRDIGKCL